MKTAITTEDKRIITNIKICIRDHGSATKALNAISTSWVTNNWVHVTDSADHKLLHSLKPRGVKWLVDTVYSIAE